MAFDLSGLSDAKYPREGNPVGNPRRCNSIMLSIGFPFDCMGFSSAAPVVFRTVDGVGMVLSCGALPLVGFERRAKVPTDKAVMLLSRSAYSIPGLYPLETGSIPMVLVCFRRIAGTCSPGNLPLAAKEMPSKCYGTGMSNVFDLLVALSSFVDRHSSSGFKPDDLL